MFRFTIRDILWLTAVVAVGLLWQAERRRAIRFEAAHQQLTTSHKQLTETLEKAKTQLAAYEEERERELHWEWSRRDPANLVHFPPPNPAATPSEAAKEAIQRIKNIGVP